MTTYYILVSVKDEPDGVTSVVWHKHLHLMLEHAAKDALEKGPDHLWWLWNKPDRSRMNG